MIYAGAHRKVDSLAQSFFNKIYVVTFLMAPVAAETIKNDEIKGAFATTVACLFGIAIAAQLLTYAGRHI